MSFFIWVHDFGEIQNRVIGRRLYKPGQIVQIHIQIDDRHVWIEQNTGADDVPLYRVAFGAVPGYSPLVPLADARQALDQFLAGVCHV